MMGSSTEDSWTGRFKLAKRPVQTVLIFSFCMRAGRLDYTESRLYLAPGTLRRLMGSVAQWRPFSTAQWRTLSWEATSVCCPACNREQALGGCPGQANPLL